MARYRQPAVAGLRKFLRFYYQQFVIFSLEYKIIRNKELGGFSERIYQSGLGHGIINWIYAINILEVIHAYELNSRSKYHVIKYTIFILFLIFYSCPGHEMFRFIHLILCWLYKAIIAALWRGINATPEPYCFTNRAFEDIKACFARGDIGNWWRNSKGRSFFRKSFARVKSSLKEWERTEKARKNGLNF